MTDGWGISCKIALSWMPLNLTDDKSTLVEVMAWCHQATSHYLNQCWPSSMSLYGVTRPQWVNFMLTFSVGDILACKGWCMKCHPYAWVINSSVAVRYKKSISIIETVISIDYRYIDFLASYFSDRSRGIDRVGDNWRTVNTSANPHISDQLTELRTEYTW